MSTHVLLLADDSSDCEALERALVEDGHEVMVMARLPGYDFEAVLYVAYTTAEFLMEQIRSAATDDSRILAIVDAWRMDFIEPTAKEIRQLQKLAEAVPTIMLTGRPWAATVAAEELGLVALVRKPVELEQLRELVARSDELLRSWEQGDPRQVWRIGGDAAKEFARHDGSVAGVAFAPDGAALASISGDGMVRLWSIADGAALQKLGPFPIHDFAFSPDGQSLGASGSDGVCRIWSVASGDMIRSLEEPNNPYRITFASSRIAFSPDGQTVATYFCMRPIHVWQLTDGALLHSVVPALDTDIVFSPDGRALVMNWISGGVAFWPIPPAAGLEVLDIRDVSAFALSPDGQVLATVKSESRDSNDVQLWDVRTFGLAVACAPSRIARVPEFARCFRPMARSSLPGAATTPSGCGEWMTKPSSAFSSWNLQAAWRSHRSPRPWHSGAAMGGSISGMWGETSSPAMAGDSE